MSGVVEIRVDPAFEAPVVQLSIRDGVVQQVWLQTQRGWERLDPVDRAALKEDES